MYKCHQPLMRLRQGDSEREIARSGLMGQAKAVRFHTLAQSWIEPSRPLPPDTEIALRRRLLRPSPAYPPRRVLARPGVSNVAIHPMPPWCASTALPATTPASVALSRHQSCSDIGEPRPTPRATDSAIDPTRQIPFTKTNERAPREFPNFSEIAAVSY